MRKKFLLFLCLLALLAMQQVASAQKLQNSLLWKITGNGLLKPSYLFGTIHLTDDRVFQLGDSLYKAIEMSDGFAIEVNPEEMTSLLVDEVQKQLSDSKKIKELLNEAAYKKYAGKLSKKLKKPADQITARDIVKEKNRWIAESYKNGKMTTFLDAYLFDVARRQGKWTGGIEDISDQQRVMDGLVDESDLAFVSSEDTDAKSDFFMNGLIETYLSNDITAIDRLSNRYDTTYREVLITRRNIKMARRMDSLSSLRSMVFAVGAAHLAGEKGVIELLRGKGFAVEPVFSSQKIAPADYKVKEVVLPWVDVADSIGLYKAQMPGKPGEVNMYGIMKMKMYFDLFSSTGYFTSAMPVPYSEKAIDSVVNRFTEYMFKQQPRNAKKIAIGGVQGNVYEYESDEGYRKGYVLVQNNVVYIAYGHAIKKNTRTLVDIDKFLASFQAFSPLEIQSATYRFSDSVMGYSVIVPSKPEAADQFIKGGERDGTTRSKMYISIDQTQGAYFFIGVNSTNPRFHIKNDSTQIQGIRQNMQDRLSTLKYDTAYLKDGNRVWECAGNMKDQGFYMKCYVELRGNRWYVLLAMFNEKTPPASVERFFSSFKIMDYPSPLWQQRVSSDGKLSSWTPVPFQLFERDSDDDIGQDTYTAFDSVGSVSYDVVIREAGKYFWQKSDSALWAWLTSNCLSYTDTLLNKTVVQNGNLSGIELVYAEKGSRVMQRQRILVAGDKVVNLYIAQPAQHIRNDNANRFFDDFEYKEQVTDTGYVRRPKADQLLNDILSADSATRAGALAAFRGAPFDSTDVSALHSVLLKCRDTVNAGYYDSPSEKILDLLISWKKPQTLQFAHDQLAQSPPPVKQYLLRIISAYATESNYQRLKELLLGKPVVKPDHAIESNLIRNDSITAGIIGDLLPLLKDSNYLPMVLSVTQSLVEDSLFTIEAVKPYADVLLKFSEKRLRQNKLEKDYAYIDLDLVDILGRIGNPACMAALKNWLLVPAKYPAIRSLEQLLKHKQAVPATQLTRFGADKAYRLDLYEILEKEKKLSLFPKQYKTQKLFAESRIYNLATDDYEPQNIVFVKSETLLFNGKKSVFYFYKVNYEEEEDNYYLAVAGPFGLNPAQLTTGNYLDTMLWEDIFEAEKFNEQKQKLLEQMQELQKSRAEK